jgi:hypothetical protein
MARLVPPCHIVVSFVGGFGPISGSGDNVENLSHFQV